MCRAAKIAFTRRDTGVSTRGGGENIDGASGTFASIDCQTLVSIVSPVERSISRSEKGNSTPLTGR